MMSRRWLLLPLVLIVIGVAACDPLAPIPTPTAVVLIVTPEASATPPPTLTPVATATPSVTPTPESSPTPTAFPCLEEGGRVLTFDDFESEVADENLPYRVYIPPCYLDTQKRYPVVYLLHGLRQDENTWMDVGVVQALDQAIRLGAIGPMIVVMPSLGAIGTLDQFPPDPSFESVLLDELLPAIERDFCTINDRAYRGLGGISRGGFWAYSIGMRHPDVFSKLGGHSAAFDEDNAPAANNPLELALNAAFLSAADLDLYLDNAASDPAGTGLELFSSRLSSRGIPHTYIIHPTGDHSEDYWSAHVQEYLSFYGTGWPLSDAELPSCLQPSP
jgi:enterochelin esterase-like enzyme